MKFAVWRTSVECIEFCWRERRLLLRFAGPPFIVAVLVSALALGAVTDQSYVAIAGLALVQMLIFAPATITWYRIVVLGEDEARNRPVFTLGRLEWRMIAWQIGALAAFGCLAVACGGITVWFANMNSLPITLLNVVWSIAWVIGILYALMRLGVLMALIAMDEPIDFKAIWRMTTGVTGRLFSCTALLGLAALVVGLGFKLLGFIVGTLGAITADSKLQKILVYIELVGNTLVNTLSVIFTATLFGFVYKMLTAHALSTAAYMPPSDDVQTELPPPAPAPTSPSRGWSRAQIINAAIWLFVWLGGLFQPTVVPEGGNFWIEKGTQIFRPERFDDVPRLLGQGVSLFAIWLVIHLILGRKKKAPASPPGPSSHL